MKLPGTGKLIQEAKQRGLCAYVVYLGKPQSPINEEMCFSGLMTAEDYEKLSAVMMDIMRKKR